MMQLEYLNWVEGCYVSTMQGGSRGKNKLSHLNFVALPPPYFLPTLSSFHHSASLIVAMQASNWNDCKSGRRMKIPRGRKGYLYYLTMLHMEGALSRKIVTIDPALWTLNDEP